MALAAYRHLLRATAIAFQGDMRMLEAARREARKQFDQNRNLSSDSEEVTKAIGHAEDTARILKHNLAQGRQAERGTQRYKLRIHEHIERGDNDGLKRDILGKKATTEGCWSQQQ
ncbi:MAG: Mitochondrial zinc maintenance protein 1, mitochondrial [Peltula sp. TS41687]|nr:MAG: Mitochondrial zinc maintenance protein 1, mitochondrial [Peltula sp. TS41687]